MDQKSRRLRLLVGSAIALVAVVPSGVLAAERFADVPETSPIHADVEALASAGVVRGCGSTAENYCPDRTVTRGEMAQYLHRSLPSVSVDDFAGPLTGTTTVPVATIDVDVPGRTGGTQQVRLDANITIAHVGGGCFPCGAFFHLTDESGDQTIPREVLLAFSSDVQQATISGVFAADAGTTETFTLHARPYPPGPNPIPIYDLGGELVAETFPMTN